MASTAGRDLRSIALVGHGGAGKTTLAECLLHRAQAINRQGRVQDGTTVSDFAEDERERGHSIDSSLLHCTWKGELLQIVDTPGYPDFYGQASLGLDAADCAVVVVHAFDGVALNTRRLFRAAGERGIPRIVVVNRCDAENVDAQKLRGQIEELAGRAARPVTVPDGWGGSFSAVKSIFGEAADQKEGFVEAAVEADDAVMEKYLEEGEISDEDLARAIPAALRSGTLIPVFHTSAEQGIGVPELLDFLADFGPAPAGRTVPDREGGSVEGRLDAPLRALCFKVTFDRQAGKIVFLRVFSGSLRPGDQAVASPGGETIKIGHMSRMQGAGRSEIDQAPAGSLVALTKVEEIALGDTLHPAANAVHLEPIATPEPMVGLAVQPKARGDEAKISRELQRLAECDPCLLVERTRETNELVLRGLSPLHVDVALKRLARAGVEVSTSTPRVAYRETITAHAEGHYRHKKQTGGAGQFGEVYLKVEPLERGADDPLDFVREIYGGAIPQQFLPAVEKGVRQKMAEGVVAGYPVVDVRVRVYDGKHHDVDSKEIAFIIAGRNAFALAVEAARPVLLEPVVNVEVEVPSRFMGDITSDLNSRRARIQGMDSLGDLQIVRAEAPLAEMQTYSTQLR
ncbi:MAG: elongation factor G, partial [Planctomycetota bacterium]